MTHPFLYYSKIPCLGALTIYMSQGVGLSCLKFNELGCTHTYTLPIGFGMGLVYIHTAHWIGMGLVNVFLPLFLLIPFWDFYSMYVDTLLPGPLSCLFSIKVLFSSIVQVDLKLAMYPGL